MSLAPSSPRLPSPPPPAEIQIGPKSPSSDPDANPQAAQMEQSLLDANSKRRIHPGTKASDMAAGPPLIPLHELDSAFQLQEHLAALHCYHTSSNTRPLTRATALELAQPPAGIDRTLWLYELCRFLISQCNSLIVGFLFDTPPCSANTCPEMRASEWQFLCAVHEQPKSCCAIDYCCHTLDWAANVVTDQKIFPSRFVVLNDAHSKNVGVKNLVNVFRRLHRIFAHAWFQHRGVFWSVEGQTGMYVFFKAVCDLYDLLPAENYKLPPEAEGLEAPVAEEPEKPTPQILKPPSQRGPGVEEDNHHPARTNTRRHIRSSPSTGSAVTTVIEADEEDADGVTRRMKNMHLGAPATVNEESDVAEVPVIVEQSVMDQQQPSTDAPQPLPSGKDDDAVSEVSDADQTIVEVELEDDEDTKAEGSSLTNGTQASHTEAAPQVSLQEIVPEDEPEDGRDADKSSEDHKQGDAATTVDINAATDDPPSTEDAASEEPRTQDESPEAGK